MSDERMTTDEQPRVDLLGICFDAVTREEMVDRVDRAVARNDHIWLTMINVAVLIESHRNAAALAALEAADYRLCDGMGIVYGSRILHRPLPETIGGPLLMFRLLQHAESAGMRVFLLGTREDVLARAVKRLRTLHPRLHVAGYRNGYFDTAEEPAVVREIAASRAHILFVGMGFPRERLFLARRRRELDVPVCMDVGGAFTILADIHALAPRWVRVAGMEWIYRAAQEPRRLGPRYLRTNPVFAARLVREAWRQGAHRRRSPRRKGPDGEPETARVLAQAQDSAESTLKPP